MKIPLYIFEDKKWKNFGPVTSLRPVWDIRIGVETVAQRISRKLKFKNQGFLPRPELKKVLLKQIDNKQVIELPEKGDVFLVNGRNLGDVPVDGLKNKLKWTIWSEKDSVVAARIPVDVARKW